MIYAYFKYISELGVITFQVFERMARNLVAIGRQQGRMGDSLLCLRNALELFLIICPNDLDTRLLQVRVNLHLNINLPDVSCNFTKKIWSHGYKTFHAQVKIYSAHRLQGRRGL